MSVSIYESHHQFANTASYQYNKGWRNATSGWIDGCDLRRYTATDWKSSGINNWISSELKKFNAHARDDEEFARDYLIPIYASKAASSQLTACYVDRQCSVSLSSILTCHSTHLPKTRSSAAVTTSIQISTVRPKSTL